MIRSLGEDLHLDHDFINEMMPRLAAIPAERIPKWGRLDKVAMIAHLTAYLKYSLGRIPPSSGYYHPFRPLLRAYYLNLPLRWPRNLQCPIGGANGAPAGAADLEELEALLEDYVAQVHADVFTPPPHPVLGSIGIDGWDRFHLRHFEHHLRQFDA